MELVNQAMRCLENNDKQCAMRLIEELVRSQCHDGRLVSKEVADKVKDVVHDLWLVSDNECRCELLRMLKSLDVLRGWIRKALDMNTKKLNKWLARCSIDGKSKMARNNIVEDVEDLLRDVLGWDETGMCEELMRFIGIDVNEFRRHGIEPCIWLIGLEGLRSLKRPYWFGLRVSDLAVRRREKYIELKLRTTNTIDAVFFPILLSVVKTPSLEIEWGRAIPWTRHVTRSIDLSFCVYLGIDEWPWPTELSADELEKILNNLSDEGLAMFIAGLIDGDGSIQRKSKSDYHAVIVITACKACPKKVILDVLKRVVAERFGITGDIYSDEAANTLVFSGEDAVRLLRRVVKYIHHPLRRLRAELFLAYYEGRIDDDEFEKLYETTEYEYGGPDIKRNHGLDVLARAAPQTHTHGG
ncbi:hypothetical protein B7L70_04550 [Vulcanisaeta sp. EB80]|uniref:LAGLIDADG family homing endonuclease n=1 Tax=Vulcanisaeta sp. EB80 TaxID=1650660 RepID=UPI0009BFB9C4|nr:LAGLIDADG family homing endonuclease [Vulcanisaeta sp. EB80]PLC68253.1 hypothetical protein B7L70_04550 [Vulcanisaeta sp. EB80]